MTVVRAWLRGLLRASGVTLLVPFGLLAAVAVAATLGGSGLGAVGQLVGGPEVPASEQRAATSQRDEDLPTVPARKRRASSRRAAPARTTRATVLAAAPAAVRRRRPSGRAPSVATKGPATARPVAPPPAATTTTPPATTTTAETNPVRRLGGAVQKAVAPVPVVGPVAAGAVGTVIDLLVPKSQ